MFGAAVVCEIRLDRSVQADCNIRCLIVKPSSYEYEAKSYSTSSNRSRGFARWIRSFYFVEPEYITLPMKKAKHSDQVEQRRWCVLPPLAVALQLRKRAPELLYSLSAGEQTEFWDKRGP